MRLPSSVWTGNALAVDRDVHPLAILLSALILDHIRKLNGANVKRRPESSNKGQ